MPIFSKSSNKVFSKIEFFAKLIFLNNSEETPKKFDSEVSKESPGSVIRLIFPRKDT